MTDYEFKGQLERLERQFGKFGTERGMLLWREVKDFSGEWFRGVIDKLIGECRSGPSLVEFREEISKERERKHRVEKQQNTEFFQTETGSSYSHEDEKTLIAMMIKRLDGNVPDQEWEGHVKSLHAIADSKTRMSNARLCSQCCNSGLVVDRTNCAWKCYCEHGQARTERFPTFSRGQT